jgi:hypothetical protein
MKYQYVFLLGRPGCGKSALYRELESQFLTSGQAQTFERVDDFPNLWAKFQRDNALEKEGKERIYFEHPTDGTYIPFNGVLDDILKEVNSDVLQIDTPDHMVFIEFARQSYIEALQNFDRGILDNCLVIYMEVNFDVCWARNVARHEAAIAEGGDDHLVPRGTMEEIYLHDDQDALVQHLKDQNIPVAVVNNEADGEEHLGRQVQELVKILF